MTVLEPFADLSTRYGATGALVGALVVVVAAVVVVRGVAS